MPVIDDVVQTKSYHHIYLDISFRRYYLVGFPFIQHQLLVLAVALFFSKKEMEEAPSVIFRQV